MMRLITVFACFGIFIKVSAQDMQEARPKINFDLSIINRTVIDLTYSFSPTSRVMLDWQLSGTGINYGFQLYVPSWKVGFKGSQSLRYDHIFSEMPANNPGMNYAKDVRGLIVDYHFDALKYWNFKKWSFFASAGVSLMNTGTDYTYSVVSSSTPGGIAYGYKDSRFNAYNFTAGCNIKNLVVSLGTFYTPNAYNYPNAPRLLIPEVRIGYSFRVIK